MALRPAAKRVSDAADVRRSDGSVRGSDACVRRADSVVREADRMCVRLQSGPRTVTHCAVNTPVNKSPWTAIYSQAVPA